MISILVPERLAGFQCVLDALERLALATQFQERFALQIEEVLLADRRLVRQCASRAVVGGGGARRPRRLASAGRRPASVSLTRPPRQARWIPSFRAASTV